MRKAIVTIGYLKFLMDESDAATLIDIIARSSETEYHYVNGEYQYEDKGIPDLNIECKQIVPYIPEPEPKAEPDCKEGIKLAKDDLPF